MAMSEGTAILPDFVKAFPFESQLSLALLIRFWEEQAKEETIWASCTWRVLESPKTTSKPICGSA